MTDEAIADHLISEICTMLHDHGCRNHEGQRILLSIVATSILLDGDGAMPLNDCMRLLFEMVNTNKVPEGETVQ